MNAGAPLLELEGVSKRFGPVQALDRVDFAVHAGEVVGLVGDNGAGKSTLVKTIAGIHAADAGAIRFDGEEVSISKPQDATGLGIATVYQDLALCDNLDVVANLFLGREEVAPGPGAVSRQLDEARMEHQTGELLSNLAVTIPSLRSEVGTLSGGQRQQVAVARSLLGEPQGRAARRADRGARRRPDRAGPEPDPAPARARARRRRDQPQPGRRLRGRRPDLRPAARPQRPASSTPKRPPRSTSSRRSPGSAEGEKKNGDDVGAGGDERRGRRAPPTRRRSRPTAARRCGASSRATSPRCGW